MDTQQRFTRRVRYPATDGSCGNKAEYNIVECLTCNDSYRCATTVRSTFPILLPRESITLSGKHIRSRAKVLEDDAALIIAANTRNAITRTVCPKQRTGYA